MYLQGRSLKLRRKGRRSDPRRVLLLIALMEDWEEEIVAANAEATLLHNI